MYVNMPLLKLLWVEPANKAKYKVCSSIHTLYAQAT